MKFKQYNQLNEAFDKPYKYKQTSKTSIQAKYQFFEDNSDDEFEVTITEFDKYLDKTWQYGFVIVFNKNNSAKISTSNSPFRVFATIVDITKNEIKNSKKDIVFIEFSAAEGEKSRIKLYRRMAESFRKKLKWDIVIEENESGDIFFTIYKNK
jgi:hypothetical protein